MTSSANGRAEDPCSRGRAPAGQPQGLLEGAPVRLVAAASARRERRQRAAGAGTAGAGDALPIRPKGLKSEVRAPEVHNSAHGTGMAGGRAGRWAGLPHARVGLEDALAAGTACGRCQCGASAIAEGASAAGAGEGGGAEVARGRPVAADADAAHIWCQRAAGTRAAGAGDGRAGGARKRPGRACRPRGCPRAA